MALPYSTRESWVVKTVATNITSTDQLKPFELGIFDYGTNKPVRDFTQSPYIFFACGSPNQKSRITTHPRLKPLNYIRNEDVSFKTSKIYGKSFLPDSRVSKPKKTTNPLVTYIGYDGINPCTNLDFQPGKTYLLTFKIFGSAAKSIYGKEFQDTVEVTLPTLDECTPTSCTPINACYMVADEVVNKINMSWIAPVIRAEKIMSCCDDTPLEKFYVREWTLTINDEGNENALARIQKYYNQKISLKERVGIVSTYSFVQPEGAPAPADFVADLTRIVDCQECEEGYLEIAPAKILVVKIENGGLAVNDAQALAEVKTVSALSTAVTAVKTGYAFGTSTYVVTVPTTWVAPTSPIANVEILETGSVSPKICTRKNQIIHTWTLGEQKYRIKRELELTVAKPDGECETLETAKIQSIYAQLPDVVPGSVQLKEEGDCRAIFSLEQFSEPMEDGCDTIGVAKFGSLPTYKWHAWKTALCEGWTETPTGCPVPPPAAPLKDCRCGIKIIGGMLDYTTQTAIFDPVEAVNYDPVYYEVSVAELAEVGDPMGIKITNTNITRDRAFTRKFLTGQEVIRQIMDYRYYRQNEMYMNPQAFAGAYKFNEAEGQKFGVDINKFYYAVNLVWDLKGDHYNAHMDMSNRRELTLYFAEEDYQEMVKFLNIYNSYAMTQGLNLPALVI